MNIEFRPVADIKPYPNNPRVNDNAVDAVAHSIKEFGFRQPIVVDDKGVIVVGHTRWKAAQKLGMQMVPVHVALGLTEVQLKSYRIADNKTAMLSTWDFELLPIELAELKALDIDIASLGFDQDDLARIFAGDLKQGLVDPDSVPEPPDKATTKRGDIYLFGEHRLMCGDSASAEDVDALLGGATIQIANCDPPYGVKVEPRSNNAISAGLSSFAPSKPTHHQKFDAARNPASAQATHKKMRARDRPLENDFLSVEDFGACLDAWFRQISRVLEPGRAFFIWGGYGNLGNYPPALAANKLYFSQAIIWHKMWPVLTRKDFMGDHEWCFYGWREGAAHVFLGPNNIPDVWPIRKIPPQQMEHLTAKPAELAVRAMTYCSRPGENCIDLFGGSGSTLIAAEQTGRRAFLMEIDELYCDVIIQRFESFTSKKATLLTAGPNAKESAVAPAYA